MPVGIRGQSCVVAVGQSGCLGCGPDVSLEGRAVGVQPGRAVPSAGVVRSTLSVHFRFLGGDGALSLRPLSPSSCAWRRLRQSEEVGAGECGHVAETASYSVQ